MLIPTMADDMSNYYLPKTQTFVELDCTEAFNNLTDQEKLYAHYLTQAAWSGGLIVLLQTSPESPRIFSLLHRIFLGESLESLKKSALEMKVSEDDFQAFLIYAGGFFSNMGNYKGFGDTKFIPYLSKETFEQIIKASKAYENDTTHITKLWLNTQNAMYNLAPRLRSLGLSDKGVTTYFSSNCNETDAKLVSEWMKSKKIEAVNSRTFKSKHTDGLPVYIIHLASEKTSPKPNLTMEKEVFKNAYFQITRGDYSPLLKLVTDQLEIAKQHAANDTEKDMLTHYIKSFKEGNLDDHKEGSKFWIKNKGPIIETYIGFIETYRDPSGQRGEFEAFVAMVNKEMSKKFSELVISAEKFITLLPWGRDLEKDEFKRPDFTSLDVLCFAGSGIPAGINIPNYDEIRENVGFKNVSLGNVIPASYKGRDMPFVSEADKAMLEKYKIDAFEVQVGLHELLGHGSGKLFRETAPGVFNFDKNKVKNPLTGELITSWYGEGDTYDSKFSNVGSAFEECRAEAVGLYLCLEPEILKIFGYKAEEAENVIYVNWLSLLWNACAKALELYQPATKTWLQAHAQARFVLMRLLELEGNGMLEITETDPGKNLLIKLDRSRIKTDGKRIIGEFLVKLQTIKSTGDVKAGNKLFDKYSKVDGAWASWRDIVLKHKQPRNIFVQANTVNNGGKVELKLYQPTAEGMIQSWTERFPVTNVHDILEQLAEADKVHYEDLLTLEG
ncbi:dipeptidyl peptidase 3 isoform X2 [Hyposmocoma kahamanoa]|uniref:dipeptidyl peptidase 3 isoform X2 n=1 Tax=Hyposmocoma kahamanoa TaxID=1477025 RepID=UPI000E6D8EBE|nr:dipeptidyl peptidase 3 isoform X2 [Hyposmocoma kahamanoa]